jgi:uncharacterized membrane protein
MPFSTSLMAEMVTLRTALVVYWLNILALGVILFASWRHAPRAGLIAADAPPALDGAVERRIVIAQILYALGAALCVVNTYCSIGFIILVQGIYVVGPRGGFLARM